MLSHQMANPADQKQTPQKIDMCAMTSLSPIFPAATAPFPKSCAS